MVRLKGPGLAQTAAGGLGKSLIFAQSKGRAYAKRWAAPANPDSTKQRAMRAIAQYLTHRWAKLAPADVATWANATTRKNLPAYNHYLAYNIERWRNFLSPSEVYPATEDGTINDYTGWTPTAVSRGVTHVWPVTAVADGRAFLLFMSQTSGFTPAWSNLAHLVPTLALGNVTWTQRPLKPGIYYYRSASTTRFGKKEVWGSGRTVTVT